MQKTSTAASTATRPYSFVLVLSGGNALGAYHAGVYQALHEAGVEPDWVIGASSGAVTGAVICGNAPEDRVARLHDLWQPGSASDSRRHWWSGMTEEVRRTAAVQRTMMTGRSGLFHPRLPLPRLLAPWRDIGGSSIYDTGPLLTSLPAALDLDRLNAGAPRYAATAVDIETGEDVVFDTAVHPLTVDHVRASAALSPVFPLVEIDGRAYGDGGISANLPLDPVLGAPPAGTTICLAVDVLSLTGHRPRKLGEAADRLQDLLFGCQSRRTIAAWQEIYDLRTRLDDAASVDLVHLSYADQGTEVSGKMFDYSGKTVRDRWDSGLRGGRAFLDLLEAGKLGEGRAGLSVRRLTPDTPAETEQGHVPDPR